MNNKKVARFVALAGQKIPSSFDTATPAERQLGAQLLLSETLEYIIRGLGVSLSVNGTEIKDPEGITYKAEKEVDQEEMLDGLSDVAYTMYWNSIRFGVPLEEAFEAVCDNNLEKFVLLPQWKEGERPLEREEWRCAGNTYGVDVVWPPEVVQVAVIKVDGMFFAVGKDARGKVRKPSTYKSVTLTHLLK